MTRIHITGASGCGKTTYAKRLSAKLKIPVFHLDEIYHNDSWGMPRLRTDAEKLKIVNDIIKNNKNWIIEGHSYGDWINPFLENSTEVYVMSIPRVVRVCRLISRYVKVKLNKEHSHYKQTVKTLCKLIKRTIEYEKKILPIIINKIPKNTKVVRIPYHK